MQGNPLQDTLYFELNGRLVMPSGEGRGLSKRVAKRGVGCATRGATGTAMVIAR